MANKSRSWWAWGHVEDAVTGAELDGMLSRVRNMLPDADLTPTAVPAVAELGIPESRVAAPDALAPLCSDDLADRAAHAHGKAFRDVVRNLAGELEHVPDLVVRPVTEQDVVDVLDWCTRSNIAVIAYGGGSSVVGGLRSIALRRSRKRPPSKR